MKCKKTRKLTSTFFLVCLLLLPLNITGVEGINSQSTEISTNVPNVHFVSIKIIGKGLVKVDDISYRDGEYIPVERLKEQTYECIADKGYTLSKIIYNDNKIVVEKGNGRYVFTAPTISEDNISLAVWFIEEGRPHLNFKQKPILESKNPAIGEQKTFKLKPIEKGSIKVSKLDDAYNGVLALLICLVIGGWFLIVKRKKNDKENEGS